MRPRQGTSVLLLVEERGLEAAIRLSHALPALPRHLVWALGGVLSQSWFWLRGPSATCILGVTHATLGV